jgi:hypothetical protein
MREGRREREIQRCSRVSDNSMKEKRKKKLLVRIHAGKGALPRSDAGSVHPGPSQHSFS